MMACGMSLFRVFFLDCFWMLVFLFVMMVVQINLVVVMSLLPTHMHAMRQSRIVGRWVPVMPRMVARLRFHQTKAGKEEKDRKLGEKLRTKAHEWAFSDGERVNDRKKRFRGKMSTVEMSTIQKDNTRNVNDIKCRANLKSKVENFFVSWQFELLAFLKLAFSVWNANKAKNLSLSIAVEFIWSFIFLTVGISDRWHFELLSFQVVDILGHWHFLVVDILGCWHFQLLTFLIFSNFRRWHFDFWHFAPEPKKLINLGNLRTIVYLGFMCVTNCMMIDE